MIRKIHIEGYRSIKKLVLELRTINVLTGPNGCGGATLGVEASGTVFQLKLQIPGLLRPLDTRELSDGQLRYLCLCAALLSPRPPSLLALNEPETSLHPHLIGPLARLIVRASRDTQLWITTHAKELADHIEKHSGIDRVRLHMESGETRVQ